MISYTLEWYNWIDFGQVFPIADLIVHHGGMGTTRSAISHSKPQVVIPQGPDQFYHASRIVKFGLGTQLQKERITKKILAQSIENTLKDRTIDGGYSYIRQKFNQMDKAASLPELFQQLVRGELPFVKEQDLPDLPVSCHDFIK